MDRLVELLGHGALEQRAGSISDLTTYRAALTEIQASGREMSSSWS